MTTLTVFLKKYLNFKGHVFQFHVLVFERFTETRGLTSGLQTNLQLKIVEFCTNGTNF